MKIVADENIPFVEQAFQKLGEVVTYPGRHINSAAVKPADILLVRSITKVDENLLRGSKIRFVATATIGLDHIDVDYLEKENIQLASAAGCNANSVAEYVTAALLILARRHGFSLSEKTIGVVGVGNVGSRVVEKAGILNMNILQNDPPLARKTGEARFRPLEEILKQSDILTLHVPLTYGKCSIFSPHPNPLPPSSTVSEEKTSVPSRGEDKGGGNPQDATYRMGNSTFFEKMKKGSFLINTSRGAVVDNPALLMALKQNRLMGAVLDVWEGEPEINEELLRKVDLGTPHIAGYSLDGKTNATLLIYRAVCQFLNASCDWQLPELPSPPCPKIEVNESGENDEGILAEVVGKAYDLERDDKTLRQILEVPQSQRRNFFDQLRSKYPVRREFNSIEVNVKGANQRLSQKLKALGFRQL